MQATGFDIYDGVPIGSVGTPKFYRGVVASRTGIMSDWGPAGGQPGGRPVAPSVASTPASQALTVPRVVLLINNNT